jgi:hypothetical protein
MIVISFIVLATVIMIVNYDRKTFIVHVTDDITDSKYKLLHFLTTIFFY